MVAWWKRCNSQCSRREKHNRPLPAPRIKTSRNSRSRDLTAASTVPYIPSSTRMKLPEMPGRIIAQMARNPDRNTPARPNSILAVGEKAISPAAAAPASRHSRRGAVQPSIWRNNTAADARIRPKKNAQSGTGWLSSTQEMSLAREKILVPIPSKRASRKLPLTCCQAPRMSRRQRRASSSRSKRRILPSRVS